MSAIDVITVALGSGGAITTLTAVIREWLRQKKDHPVTVRVEGRNISVTLDAAKMSTDEIERILRDITDEVEDHSPKDRELPTDSAPD
jgi:cysteine synthase